jgi:hypothetical protein
LRFGAFGPKGLQEPKLSCCGKIHQIKMKPNRLICTIWFSFLAAISAWGDSLYMPLNSLDVAAQRAPAINCANQLSQILAAARSWSNDNLDQPPPSLEVLSNDLPSPAVLFCPANLITAVPTNWAQVDWTKIDYTWVSPPDWSNPTNVACVCRIHNNYGRVEGSVSVGDYRPGWPYLTATPPWVFATPGENVRFQFNYASNALLPVTFQWRREHVSYVTNITRYVNPDDPTGIYWRTNVVGRFDHTNLPGQTNLTLYISNAQAADNDYYSVAVSNAIGLCVSHPTRLLIDVSAAGVATNEQWSRAFCVNNLKMIGLAARLVSDNASDPIFSPGSFQALTNRDGSPLLGWPTALFCRSDTNRSAPADWSAVDFSNTSYEMVPGDPQNPYAIFCRCQVHSFYVQMNGDVIQQPRFNSIHRLSDGSFNLSFHAFAGKTNFLETSIDLRNWKLVKSYDNVLGDVEFIDSGPRAAQGFYRVRLP